MGLLSVHHPPRASLDELMVRLEMLQSRIPARSASRLLIPTGWDEIDQRLGGGLSTGTVHEWFSSDGMVSQLVRTGMPDVPPNSSSSSAKPQATQKRHHIATSPNHRFTISNRRSSIVNRQSFSPPLSILIHLAGQALHHDPHRSVVWIGRTCRPYFRALIHNPGREHEDRRLLDQSMFIDGANLDFNARLWAIDLAARSPALSCIVADGSGLDMRTSRRLQLAAQHGSALILLARPAQELKKLSAAATRWTVEATTHPQVHTSTNPNRQSSIINRQFFPSPHHFITSSLHHPTPRWTVQLLRCKGLQPVIRAHELPCEFALEVCRETGSLCLSSDVVDRPGQEANEEGSAAPIRRSA